MVDLLEWIYESSSRLLRRNVAAIDAFIKRSEKGTVETGRLRRIALLFQTYNESMFKMLGRSIPSDTLCFFYNSGPLHSVQFDHFVPFFEAVKIPLI